MKLIISVSNADNIPLYSRLYNPEQNHMLYSRNDISHFHGRWMILSLWQEPIYKWSQCLCPINNNLWSVTTFIRTCKSMTWSVSLDLFKCENYSRLCTSVFVCEGSAGCVWWTKTKETNVDTADFESASEPAWGEKVKPESISF